MKTGLVIIHYNDIDSVSCLIKNVIDYKVIDKIVIVDNNSRDDIKKKLRDFKSSKIEIIENASNRGFAAAINIGCRYLINELGKCNLIISNSDIIINSEDDLKSLVKYLSDNSVGVVAPTIIENGNLNRGWKNPRPFIDGLMNLILIHRFIRRKFVFYNNDHYKGKFSCVDVVSGCFFLINSTILEKINYFDEGTFLYYEENILAKKIHNINLNILVINEISIIHNHSISIDKNLKKIEKLKLQKKSQIYFHKKYNHASIFSVLFLRLTAFISRVILRVFYIFKDIVYKINKKWHIS